MDDLISRQAAIDSMCELMRHWFGCDSKDEIREIKRELGKLPPAQPDTRLKKIADLVDGSIDHFDLEDAMDLLYQIKEVLK